jgi:hypothetical protein
VNFFGQQVSPIALFMFAVGIFFLTGVVVFIRQGIRFLAVVAFAVAALAMIAGVLRL